MLFLPKYYTNGSLEKLYQYQLVKWYNNFHVVKRCGTDEIIQSNKVIGKRKVWNFSFLLKGYKKL